jgi:hypothetical protein
LGYLGVPAPAPAPAPAPGKSRRELFDDGVDEPEPEDFFTLIPDEERSVTSSPDFLLNAEMKYSKKKRECEWDENT